MKAVADNIIFKYEEIKQTEGGIALLHSNDAKESSIVCDVIAVGSLVDSVKVGDKIIIPKLMKTVVDAESCLFSTKESQVLAIVE